jgi:hypothetical protein
MLVAICHLLALDAERCPRHGSQPFGADVFQIMQAHSESALVSYLRQAIERELDELATARLRRSPQL